MTSLVIDSNIFFAALINKNSIVRDVIFSRKFQLYSSNFLIIEIFKYKEFLLKKSNQNEDVFLDNLNIIIDYTDLVNSFQISTSSILQTFNLCKDIDEKDTPFVALAIEKDIKIWTRDDELKRGLAKKGWNKFFDETRII